MRMPYKRVWAAAALSLLGGCPGSETTVASTQMVVTLNTDLAVGSQLVRIEAELFDAEGKGAAVESRSFALSSGKPHEGEVQVPFSFGIHQGRAERFRLVITGYGVRASNAAEEPVIEQKVVASFQEHQTLLLKLFLSQSCFTNLCDGSTTCYSQSAQDVAAGDCGPIPVRTDLPRIKPGAESQTWTEGGSLDGGVEGQGDDGSIDETLPDGSMRGEASLDASDEVVSLEAGSGMAKDGSAVDFGPDEAGSAPSDGGPASDAVVDGVVPDGSNGCPGGYANVQDGCVDINECAVGNGGCGQRCTNKNGGYTCSCTSGYKLAVDARACDLLAWGAVTPLDRTSDNASSPQIAVDQYGGAIAIWNQSPVGGSAHSVWSSSYDGQTWSEPIAISAGVDANAEVIAMNDVGASVALWQQNSGDGSYDLWARRYLIGQRWLTPVQLDTTASQIQSPTAVVDPQGNIFVAWTRVAGGGGAVWTSRFDVTANAWSAAGALSSGAGQTAVVPGPVRLAVDAAGIVWASWTQTLSDTWSLWVNRYVPGTGWGPGTALASTSNAGGLPSLALQPSGDALIAWNRFELSSQSVNWLNCSAGLACSTPTLLASNASAANLVIDAQGVITAVWASAGSPMWSRKSPGQGWLQSQPVAGNRVGASVPSLVVDRSANVMALWGELEGEGIGSLWYARFVPGGAWSAPRLLQGQTGSVAGLSADVDAAGRIVAAWGQDDGTRFNTLSRRLE